MEVSRHESRSWLEVLHAAPPQTIALRSQVTTMTYHQLASATSWLSQWLGEHGIGSLALLMDNGPAQVVADLASMSERSWNVQIPPFFNAQQLEHVLHSSGCRYLLIDEAAAPEQLADLTTGKLHFVSTVEIVDTQCSLFSVPGVTSAAPMVLPGTVKVSFTSGSTGLPKGLCYALEQLQEPARSVATRLDDGSINSHLSLLPQSLLLESVAGIYASLLATKCCCVPGLVEAGFGAATAGNGTTLLNCLVSYQANSGILVPALLQALLGKLPNPRVVMPEPNGCGDDAATSPDTAAAVNDRYGCLTSLSCYHHLAVGGAPVASSLLQQGEALGLSVYQGYGLSEAGSVVSLNSRRGNLVGSVGKTLPHQRVEIDSEGQLWLSKPGFLGYCGQDRPVTGAFPTGDLGVLDAQGYLHVAGRVDAVLTTAAGRNISPEWIEGELLLSPHISQACVLLDSSAQLRALVVTSLCESSLDQLILEANLRLPTYARLHSWSRVTPFLAANGELTVNGKLRRSAIAANRAAADAA